MRFVIYGAGYRGKEILKRLGREYVEAFIDADKEKIGKRISGVLIISLEDYIKNYTCFFIINSVIYDRTIGTTLFEKGISQFTNSEYLPQELTGNGNIVFFENYIELVKNEKSILYGLNAFSILLQDIAVTQFSITINIIPEDGCDSRLIDWSIKNNVKLEFPKNSIEEGAILLNTTCDIKQYDAIYSEINLYEYPIDMKYYQNDKLQTVREKYKNDRCFIVATGPSLLIDDIYTLTNNNIFTFSVNKIYNFAESWKPSAYVCSDRFFIENNYDDIIKINSEYNFILSGAQNIWEKIDRLEKDNYYKIMVMSSHYYRVVEDIQNGLFSGMTVTNVAMQIAMYMGFTEIYLLGVDCNYVSGSNNYAHAEEIDFLDHRVDEMVTGYEEIQKYAKAKGIKIYNATRGGKLEVFDRVNFDDLF